jgi:uncharacterized coiled-coil protein SlyX
MVIQIDERLLPRLEAAAAHKHQTIDEFVEEILERVLPGEDSDQQFDAEIDEILHEHEWLLAQLADR